MDTQHDSSFESTVPPGPRRSRQPSRTLPHVDDANLEDLERELGEKRDMLLVHALVHYMHAGHPYVPVMR